MAADIVFLNSLLWDSPVPSPGRRVAAGLAARHRVLYVDPAENVLRGGRNRRQRVGQRMLVQETWRVPRYFASRVDRLAAPLVRLNARLIASQVIASVRALDMRNPIVCNAFVPGVSVSICDRLQSTAIVYFSTDAIEGMKEPKALHPLEAEWIERADCIVCTSESLAERFARPGRRVEFVPNGADVHLFENAAALEEPAPIRDLARPRAAYAGTIDYRCDADAICAVADRMPVVVLGYAADAQTVRRLRMHRNVRYVGAVPQAAVPAYLGAADVLLMPYLDNAATRFIYPQKLHEYLATGRPVVASRLPALAAFGDVITLASTAEFGSAAVQAAAQRDEGAEARVLTARANSWEDRVSRFERLLDELSGARASDRLT
jgi:glycosyltransferase involved in cell wall biosynthesis